MPHLAAVKQITNVTEDIRLTAQTAAVEGDVERLKDMAALAKSDHESLEAMAKLAGKAGSAKQLRSAIDTY